MSAPEPTTEELWADISDIAKFLRTSPDASDRQMSRELQAALATLRSRYEAMEAALREIADLGCVRPRETIPPYTGTCLTYGEGHGGITLLCYACIARAALAALPKEEP